MQHTLDRRTVEPSTADNVLLARIARLESFNRSVAHDLRGPLAGPSGLAQLASMALQQGDLGGAAQLVAGSSRQLAMLIEAVDGLLALAGDAPLALEAAELATCAGEALELVRSSLAHKLPGARMPKVRIAPLPRAVVRRSFSRWAARRLPPPAERRAPSPTIRCDGPPRMGARPTGSGRERSSPNRLPSVPGERLVTHIKGCASPCATQRPERPAEPLLASRSGLCCGCSGVDWFLPSDSRKCAERNSGRSAR